METPTRTLVSQFFTAVSAGELPDTLLTDDMTAWGTMQGPIDKDSYKNMIRMLTQLTVTPISFTVDSITAEDDRIVVEARSEAELITGEAYRNTYIFVFRVADGRIAHVAEHFNPLIVQQMFIPAMQALQDRS